MVVQDLLEGELNEELKTYGIDPQQEMLTDEQFEDVMSELEHRQASFPAAERLGDWAKKRSPISLPLD